MTRSEQRDGLTRVWWIWLALCLLPWILLSSLDVNLGLPAIAIFITGLFALFPSLKAFGAFKRALFAMQERDRAGEKARWANLQRTQLLGLYWATLPAWLAALGSISGLGGVACLLLVFGSVVTLQLYRIPRQVL